MGGLFQFDSEPESGSLAGHAVDADVASHQEGELFHNREAKPCAAEFPCGGVIGLRECLKQSSLRRFRNADSRIAEAEFERQVRRGMGDELERDGHVAGLGELNGVADEIQKDLPE